MNNPAKKSVVLRHDVDMLPENAGVMAEIEAKLGVVASYHFRIVKQSFDREIIRKISSLGHEIAYHYEDLKSASTVPTNSKEKAPIEVFRNNLETIRQIAPIKVISMHGNPKSKNDSRDIWKEHRYTDYGIVCEPYFDIDYSKVLYLTDTGRTWDGSKFNVRDWVTEGFGSTKGKPLNESIQFRSTQEIIAAASSDRLPNHVILSAHPQRWTNSYGFWVKELLYQNLKNLIKFFLIKLRGVNSTQKQMR